MMAAPARPRDSAREELDDLTLERARRGEPEAQRAPVERYQRPVFALLHRYRGSSAEVEDLAQETFLRVFRELPSFRPRAEIREKAGTGERRRNVMHRIARERAGLQRPPSADAELSPSERAVRRYARVGDEFQEVLAQALGPERAHELRAREEGWPWAHSIFAGCDGD